MSRFIVSSGRTIPWSAEERSGEMTRLYAMWRRFGPPSCFLSLAPDDVHQPTCIRLSYRCTDPTIWPAVEDGLLHVLSGKATPEEASAFYDKTKADKAEEYTFSIDEPDLQRLATANPVATTLFYEQLTSAIFTEIIGLPPSGHRRKTSTLDSRSKGFLGTGLAWSYVHETNGRKSLHFHASIHGGACPALLSNVAGIPELEAAVTAALDSMYHAAVPLNVHALDCARRVLRVRGVRCTFLPSPKTPRTPTITRSCYWKRRFVASSSVATNTRTRATKENQENGVAVWRGRQAIQCRRPAC